MQPQNCVAEPGVFAELVLVRSGLFGDPLLDMFPDLFVRIDLR